MMLITSLLLLGLSFIGASEYGMDYSAPSYNDNYDNMKQDVQYEYVVNDNYGNEQSKKERIGDYSRDVEWRVLQKGGGYAPSYSAPSYSAPSYSAPSYSAPAPSYSAPSYSAPAPAYGDSYDNMKQDVEYEYVINDNYGNEQSKKERIGDYSRDVEWRVLQKGGGYAPAY